MDSQTKNKVVLAIFFGGAGVALLVLIAASSYVAMRERASIAEDAPYNIDFTPVVIRGKIYINSNSVKVVGKSGRSYPRLVGRSLPGVFLRYKEKDYNLGKFQRG